MFKLRMGFKLKGENMKKLMCVIVLIISATANAAVVDSFTCEGKLEDLLTGQKAISSNSFNVLRKPVLNGPFEADIYTLGKSDLDLSIKAKNYEISANLHISYQHTARTKNGIIDARQSDCTIVSTGYCDTSDADSICSQSSSTCLSIHDPYDPSLGWTKVPFINGAPAFENRLMRPTKGFIKNDNGAAVAKYSSSCTHTGTSVE